MADFSLNKPFVYGWNGVSPYKEPDKTKPQSPGNVFITNPYIPGTLDVRWDNPILNSLNSQWAIQGVNIYRSTDSEGGPFTKINLNPIQTLYYRDQTTNQLILEEDVTNRLNKGINPINEWVFTTLNKPIVKESSQATLADSYRDVVVRVDNKDGLGPLTVPVRRVEGRTGEIFLITEDIYNPETKNYEPSRLPISSDSKIYCSYRYNTNLVKNDLYPRYFYKITTIGKNLDNITIETSLDDVKATHVHMLEKPNYIWKSIIYKNRFLLEQLGERVKIFIRREVGDRCLNYSDMHQQAHNVCPLCYGTGIEGGYYGPIDAIIALPEAEKHINLTDTGLRMNFTFQSWTGPSPLVRTRDFIVRQNGERLMIGAVIPQGPHGSVYQQHFTLNYRDSTDIIYQVPIHGGEYQVPKADSTRSKDGVTDASPVIPSDKSERADTDKGRTIVYENITW